ncbi:MULTISPECIES: DMT family transporter [Paraburkholderia]|uniref:DMT family transporter n=1 Tax=Paraburkholderia TaxID=1822464 RepID=UPI00225195E6|nr:MULTISPECIES: EamA family transporter [Paraburkholderia]MCX4160034.1 EamA family transporter [Paraburkholderia megapolitana]MDN7155534.1 EamA family transporter [Paraburkholderia sp. CHISQ3]MDQ6492578.1 EamA family transporter [Paraburkholderia megapolitana]
MSLATTTPMDWRTHRGLVALAVGYQWFYNGANFLAFKVAGNAMHPLMVATLRFSFAALIMLPFGITRWRRVPASAREVAGAALIGITMLVASQALAVWGTHFLPAGVAAIFGSSSPLFLALFAWAVFHRPLAARQVAGVAVGIVGLALMGWTSATGSDFRPMGAALALTACAAWAAGSLLASHVALPRDPVLSLTVQLVSASVVLSGIVTVSGIAATTHLANVPASAWAAIAFLVVASTLIGYAVFLKLNAEVSSTLANTFNYAAPVVALGLSTVLLHEPLTLVKLVSGAIALIGVALMIGGTKRV